MPNVFSVDGSTYTDIAHAYRSAGTSGCINSTSPSPVYQTCEVWDYNLGNGETMYASPWDFNGGEVPVHLRLGPVVLTIQGPLVVPRNSTIEGAGRTVSSTYAAGTVIKVGSNFGAVGYVTWSGGSGCGNSAHGFVSFLPMNTLGPAVASWTANASGVFQGVTMLNPGGNYGSGGTTITASVPACTPQPTLTVHPTDVRRHHWRHQRE